MNWLLDIEPDVLDAIAAWWQDYPALPDLVMQRLFDELAADPDAHLGPAMVPTAYRPYYMVFDGYAGIPDGLTCTFAVLRAPGAGGLPGTLLLWSCQRAP